jgi:carboxyl-terminal processing protease
MLDEEIGYLKLSAFSKTTVDEVDERLTELEASGMKALVLDLRDNPGGLFEAAISVAARFLPAGAEVVSIKGPHKNERITVEESHRWESLPMAVLIGPKTASGAEIVAAALDAHRRATLVGEPTTGKGTVESIQELPNGWALKLSISRFYSPGDVARQGVPVEPAIPVSSDEELGHPALKAAYELLARR